MKGGGRGGGGGEGEKMSIHSLLPVRHLSHRLRCLARSPPPFRFLVIFYHRLGIIFFCFVLFCFIFMSITLLIFPPDKPKKSKKKKATIREVLPFASSFLSLPHLTPSSSSPSLSLSLTNWGGGVSRDILFELWMVSTKGNVSLSIFSENYLFGSGECELVGRGVVMLDPMVLHGGFCIDLLNNMGKVCWGKRE